MEIYFVVAFAAFAAGMAFLRVVAPKTKTLADDKLLALGEKVEPFVDAVKPKDK